MRWYTLFMFRFVAFENIFIGIAAYLIIASCATTTQETAAKPPEDAPAEAPVAPKIAVSDAAAKDKPPLDTAGEEKNRLVYYQGRQGAISSETPIDGTLDERTIGLNFIDAPVRNVARAIINDVFGETLSVADNVSGMITLTSPKPVSARIALNTLESALSESGLTLLKKPDGYLLTSFASASDGANTVPTGPNGPIGYSATIVPIKHTQPSEILRLIEPFSSSRLVLRADDNQGLIIIQGAQIDARDALNAIETFDAPFLTDRVFGMFDIRYSDAQTVKTEIESVMQLSRPQNINAVEMIALPRLNRLFIAARDENYFRDASGWVERLDKTSGGDERRLRYYVAQNTPATALAGQLSAVFGAGGVAAAPDNADEDVALVDAAAFIGGNSNRVSIVPDELNNALIIRATDTEYREILGLVERMDVLAPQVLIEATIAEVTLTDDLNYGVRWSFENAESTAILSDTGAIGAVFPGFSYTYIGSNVRAALNALASVTDVTVLSAPSIMVQNNQSANLQVGDEVPIVTQTASSVVDGDAPIVSTIQLRDTGVILEVKPRINASDVVVLDVTQEVSDVVPTTTSGIDSPTIQQRRFTSTVAVRNNGTVALGGLIRETQTDNEFGVPFLKDIPGLGNAFKSRDQSTRRTELMIFLTPKIIRDDATAQEALIHLRDKMDNLHRRFDGISGIAR